MFRVPSTFLTIVLEKDKGIQKKNLLRDEGIEAARNYSLFNDQS